MQVLVFKTNIKYKKQVNAIHPHITAHPGIIKWNVDLQDCDKVLRVETIEGNPETIETLVRNAGYDCAELND